MQPLDLHLHLILMFFCNLELLNDHFTKEPVLMEICITLYLFLAGDFFLQNLARESIIFLVGDGRDSDDGPLILC